MTRRLILSDQADDSFRSIALSIAEGSGSVGTALSFIHRLRDKCETLAALPGVLGRARPELGANLRSFAVGNYVIVFRYVGDDVFAVVDVIDGRRDIDSLFADR